MQTVKLTVSLEIDGQQVDGFPVVRRLSLDEVQHFNYEKVTGGGYVDVPAGELSIIQFLLLRADKVVTLRLNNQVDAGLVLNASGLVVIIDSTIDSGTNRARIDNSSGATAIVKGVAGGT